MRSSFRTFVLSCLMGCGVTLTVSAPRTLAAQEVKSIKPGMTADEVKAAWGDPLTTRTRGSFSYLYFKNDCLRTCGTWDVVILENGQVVDAVVRASYHQYEGTSSSPRDRKPGYTKP
jgi:hypothetical protein